jgi:predicted lipoprotein with Yx(FWY)xxD motif
MRHFLATLGIVFLTACASQPASKPSPPPPPPVKVTGGVLVNSNGMTLYTYDRDVAGSGRSECNGQCAFIWPPLGAGNGTPSGDFTIITREGGQRQWCYKGKPLYLFSGDANPGDNAGNGVNGVWQVATP